MRIIDNPLKWIICIGLIAVLGGCGDDQETASEPDAADDSAAVTEPAEAPEPTDETMSDDAGTSDPSEDTAAEPAAEPSDDTDEQASDSSGGEAESHTVTARATAYDPAAIKIKPGDTVAWTNMSGHNVHFEEGNIPEGAETYQSPLGDNVSRTFDVEGVYLYKCDPHFAMGMVGAIIVGEPVNLDQVEQNAKGMYKRALIQAKAAME